MYIYIYIYVYVYVCVTKLRTKTGHENMQNLKIKQYCGRARNAQGSPKAGARATFAQKNLAQPPLGTTWNHLSLAALATCKL
jgi:hypothetical protein